MKTYINYHRNRKLRRDNPNIRKIRDGKVIAVWKKEIKKEE